MAISEPARTAPPSRTGRIALRSAYGAGHFAKSLAWSFTDLLLAYYANVRLGLSAGDTGLLIFLSAVQGALADVGAASLMRRAEGDLGRILALQFVAGLAAAAALLVMFRPAHGGEVAFVCLVGALALFRTLFAFYDVAQNALVSLLPRDPEDAHHYAVMRQTLSGVARLAVAGLAFLLVGTDAPAGGREIVVAGVIVALIAASAGWLLRWRGALPMAALVGRRRSMPTGLATLLVAGAALAGPEAMAMRLVPFVEGGGPDEPAGAALLFALVLGSVIGPLGLPRPDRGVMRPALAFTALAVMAGVVFLAAPHAGVLALAACLAHGVGFGGMMALFWREMGAAIRDHALRTGVRTDMISFALLTATIKLAGALSGVGLAFLLDGFKAGTPTTMAALAAIIAVGGLVFLLTIAPGYRFGISSSGLRRATPPPGSRTT